MYIHLCLYRMAAHSLYLSLFAAQHGHSGIYLMRPSLERLQHPEGVLPVRRFPQYLLIQHHDRIRADDHEIRLFSGRHILLFSEDLRRDIFRLHERQLFYDLFRDITVIYLFFIADPDCESDADLA